MNRPPKTKLMTVDDVLDWYRDFARRGVRAPERDEHKTMFGNRHDWNLTTLAKKGLLRIEISGKNWRVIEIDGMRTAEHNPPWFVYRVIDKDGDRMVRA